MKSLDKMKSKEIKKGVTISTKKFKYGESTKGLLDPMLEPIKVGDNPMDYVVRIGNVNTQTSGTSEPREKKTEHPEVILAMLFHETYERLAPNFGYETRKDTKVFDPLSDNGRLMIAVCKEILSSPIVSDKLKKKI